MDSGIPKYPLLSYTLFMYLKIGIIGPFSTNTVVQRTHFTLKPICYKNHENTQREHTLPLSSPNCDKTREVSKENNKHFSLFSKISTNTSTRRIQHMSNLFFTRINVEPYVLFYSTLLTQGKCSCLSFYREKCASLEHMGPFLHFTHRHTHKHTEGKLFGTRQTRHL